ncbi:MAG: hypothetical protein ACRDZR_11120 [Acidimicrobiales bacterium]
MSQILADWATVATAVVALFLLAQGLRDRRQLRQEAARRQAALVMVAGHSTWVPTAPSAARLTGSTLTILNESDQAIQLDHLTLVRTGTWQQLRQRGAWTLDTTDVRPPSLLLRPRSEITVQLPAGWSLDSGITGSDFAVVFFVDAHAQWWRRRTDTYELALAHRHLNSGQRLFQYLTRRIPPVGWLFTRLPIHAARRSVTRHPDTDRTPLPLRWVRATHGYWPPGGPAEHAPWTRPDDAPPWWGYDGLESADAPQPAPPDQTAQ